MEVDLDPLLHSVLLDGVPNVLEPSCEIGWEDVDRTGPVEKGVPIRSLSLNREYSTRPDPLVDLQCVFERGEAPFKFCERVCLGGPDLLEDRFRQAAV